MTVINTNINAIDATNASNSAAKLLSTAMQQLSTGTRINSAADDAAGLAISNSMTSQINGMQQGIRNANDGISLAQTGEGALTEVTNMLQTIRNLAVQSSSGTYSATDRTNMQSEVTSLSTEINNIITGTQFNGNNVFSTSGTDATFNIQAGANTSDAVTLTSTSMSDLASANLVGASANLLVDTTAHAATTITNVESALSQVNATNAGLGAGENELSSAVNNLTSGSTNLTAARSRIKDTDYSLASTQLSKAQILSQASTAMIAQANQSAQNVLTLLK
ncbi:MAG: flagellin [Sphingomonadales bacterium]|nr:flagellin [Sphingomonadales bacterium]